MVHAAIVMLAIGVAGSSAFDSVAEAKLARGDALRIGDYTLVYRSLDERATRMRPRFVRPSTFAAVIANSERCRRARTHTRSRIKYRTKWAFAATGSRGRTSS